MIQFDRLLLYFFSFAMVINVLIFISNFKTFILLFIQNSDIVCIDRAVYIIVIN